LEGGSLRKTEEGGESQCPKCSNGCVWVIRSREGNFILVLEGATVRHQRRRGDPEGQKGRRLCDLGRAPRAILSGERGVRSSRPKKEKTRPGKKEKELYGGREDGHKASRVSLGLLMEKYLIQEKTHLPLEKDPQGC